MKSLNKHQLKQIVGGTQDTSKTKQDSVEQQATTQRQVIDKYNETAKNIIQSMGR